MSRPPRMRAAVKPAPEKSAEKAPEKPAEAPGDEGASLAAPPKPRGRPKGSTNKRGVKVTLDPKARDQLAIAPLYIAGQIVAQLTRDEDGNPVIELSYPPEALAMVKDAFAAWMDSAGLELSPGWGLIAAYVLAFGSAVPKAVQDVKDAQERGERAKVDAAKPVNAAPPVAPPAPAPTTVQTPAEPAKV